MRFAMKENADGGKYLKQIPDKFQPGDKCHICYYSDVHSCTVITVSDCGKIITVQKDKCSILNGVNSGHPEALRFSPGGFCGHTSGKQIWDIKPDPEGQILKYSFRKNGMWAKVGGAYERRFQTLSGREALL